MRFSPSGAAVSTVSQTAPAQPTLHNFFAPGGLLSRTHPAYEFRRGQLEMAQAVEQALEQKRHLLDQAIAAIREVEEALLELK